jgi:hypothetical protein
MKKFNFFTNDITKDGMESYDWPFYYQQGEMFLAVDGREKSAFNGALSTMQTGCEPICDIVSRLLKDGIFYSQYWPMPIGYMFRKNVPKLVFVFTNEYDNQYTTKYGYYSGLDYPTPILTPSIDLYNPRKTSAFNIIKGSKGPRLGSKGTRLKFVSNEAPHSQEAVDPFCMRQMSDERTLDPTTSNFDVSMNEFLTSLKMNRKTIGCNDGLNAIDWLRQNANIRSISEDNPSTIGVGADVYWKLG